MSEREFLEAVILKGRQNLRDKAFPAQDSFVTDKSRFVGAQCSRRAGKSNGLGIKFFRTLLRHSNCFCPYVSLTRDSAQNIMWPVLQELDDKFEIGFKFTPSNLTMTHPTNGSHLKLFGADMKNFIKRLKGIKTPGAAIDEAQDFGPHIESLVDDVFSPALVDYDDSWLAITGTPGPIPRGYFYDITEGQKHGFSIHKWTLFQNPYLPNAHHFVDGLKAKRDWNDRHPTYLREYLNQWVLDLESLLLVYDEGVNHYETLPTLRWNYILGIDLGLRDADALAVLAWSEQTPNIYLVEEIITKNQDITTLGNQIEDVMRRYDISKMVIDTGGLGAKIAEEFTRRKHLPVQAADKKRKFENATFLKDYLKQGKFKARKNSRFAEDSYKIQIDWEKTTPDRLVLKTGFHSDIVDAVLYAFKESPAFTFTEPPQLPKKGSPEWAEKEVTDMERMAEEHFTRIEEEENGRRSY